MSPAIEVFQCMECKDNIVIAITLPSSWFWWGRKTIKDGDKFKVSLHALEPMVISCCLGDGMRHERVKQIGPRLFKLCFTITLLLTHLVSWDAGYLVLVCGIIVSTRAGGLESSFWWTWTRTRMWLTRTLTRTRMLGLKDLVPSPYPSPAKSK